MKAIIMAGGFGTRLRPLTINLPKPMAPVANRPMMEHVVSLLAKHGITDITSLLYYQADKIRSHFGDGHAFGVRMEYAQPQEDYGTAGAVRYALESVDEPVLVISGDLVTDFDLDEAISWHRRRKSQATLLLTRVENPLAYGIVITDDDGHIIRFLEKPSWSEAFSDTINTGIYILEPEAVKLIPPKASFDFSRNLFPLMLSSEMGLYGKIMEGYWKDVGNIGEYHHVHEDFFAGKLELDTKLTRKEVDGGTLYVGTHTQLGDDFKVSGKVLLGDDVVVESGTQLHNCVIGPRSRLGRGCRLRDTVIWSDNMVGSDCTMSNAIVCNGSRLGDNVQLLDKVIVSDECRIGDGATIKANCKIWPGKKVDNGAVVSSSMVWGEKWNRELFTSSKITGLALTEITPEMLVKIGAAFGAFLGRGKAVVISRDASDTSRLLKRSLICGFLTAGVNVSDLETLPVPVARFALNQGEYAAGIYVRHSPSDYRQIDCIFFDGAGLDMPTSRLQRVEGLYIGEAFERASIDQIGRLDTPEHVPNEYRARFIESVDTELIMRAGFKVVIDYSNGSSCQVFPSLFRQLGLSAVELNANLDSGKLASSTEESSQSRVQLSAIVQSLKADVGLLLNQAAEKLTVVDERGILVDDQLLLLIMTDLVLRTNKLRRIAVPVSASMGVEAIAKEHDVEVVRVVNDHLAMMEIRRQGNVDFVGGTRGGFIFPGFQTGSDAMLAAVKLLEMLAKTKDSIGAIGRKYNSYKQQTLSVPCPWSRKGTVMRQLITGTDGKERQLIDGVRIFEDDGWVLLSPDRTTAAFNIIAESNSSERTAELINQYRQIVEQAQ